MCQNPVQVGRSQAKELTEQWSFVFSSGWFLIPEGFSQKGLMPILGDPATISQKMAFKQAFWNLSLEPKRILRCSHAFSQGFPVFLCVYIFVVLGFPAFVFLSKLFSYFSVSLLTHLSILTKKKCMEMNLPTG